MSLATESRFMALAVKSLFPLPNWLKAEQNKYICDFTEKKCIAAQKLKRLKFQKNVEYWFLTYLNRILCF